MIKIKYPNTGLVQFHNEYIEIFNIDATAINQYQKFKQKLGANILPNQLSELLVAPFTNLAAYSFSLQGISPHLKKWLKKFLVYSNYQQQIAKYFMSSRDKINLKTCYYCNIDFINAFNDIGDFENGLDLIRNGSEEDIFKIKGIGDTNLEAIIAVKNTVTRVEDLPVGSGVRGTTIKYNINNFVLKGKHNHFTLDHVLHKDMHPIAALSLYNFVPSCYPCNSKFKKEKQLVENQTEEYLSPTFDNFNFNTDVQFNILLKASIPKFLDIKNVGDFVLDFKFVQYKQQYTRYLNVFKLKGRYVFHKNEVVNLINRVKDYSESQIEEIAKITSRDIDVVKSDLFGSEIFEGNIEDKPFTKLRRDTAEIIGIKNVLKS